MAESVDAEGLNPSALSGAYGFKSHPGHRSWLGFAVGLVVLAPMLSCNSAATPSPPVVSEGLVAATPTFADGETVQVFSGDPNAEPRTALGRLRARYFPVWSQELDWAFPPERCSSPWELDAIASPVSSAPREVLGNPNRAAARAVMLYEHLLADALVRPGPLQQLCVAVAALPPARTANLQVLASYIETGKRRSEPPVYPPSVEIVAVAPAAALATACVEPGYATVLAPDGEVDAQPQAPVRLQAYLLSLASGREDAVADVSFRVSQVFHLPAEECGELLEWTEEWQQQAIAWAAEGQLWEIARARVSEEELCVSEQIPSAASGATSEQSRRAEQDSGTRSSPATVSGERFSPSDCPRNWT